MRLIDADELIKDIKEFWDYKTVDGITARTVLSQTITDITNVPTVKAIPIEWLDRYVCNITKEEKQVIDKMFIKWVGEENDNKHTI